MKKQRDFKAEYERRIKNGMKKGLSRNQAAGHARKKKGEMIATDALALIAKHDQEQKIAMEAKIAQGRREATMKMLATSPCLGCYSCKDGGLVGECVRLDQWIRRGVKYQ